MRVPGWLAVLGAALAALVAIFLGREVERRIRATLGPVESGRTWMKTSDPSAILVEAPGSATPVRVILPEGITADRVKAVAVASNSDSAVVDLHHEIKDRRGMLAGKD